MNGIMTRTFSVLSSKTLRLMLAALTVCAPLHAVHAQNAISIFSGNNQSGYPYSTLGSPLTVAFSNSSYVTDLTWTVTQGAATIVQSQNSQTYTDPSYLGTNPTPGQTASIDLSLDGTPGPVTVQVTCSGCGSGGTQTLSFSEKILQPPPYLAMELYSGNGQHGSQNSTLSSPLVVKLTPSPQGFDGPFQVPVDWTIVQGTATFTANNSTSYSQSVDVTNGPAYGKVSLALGNTTGQVIVEASCSDCTAGSIQRFYVTITASTVISKLSGDNQSGIVGSAADMPLVVGLTDSNGSPLANKTVSWSVTSGQATLGAASIQSDSNGQASINFSYGDSAGPITIRASSGGVSTDFSATAMAATASVVSGNNQTGVVGQALQPFVVQIASPSVVKGLSQVPAIGQVPVTWTVVSGGGSLSTATTYTNANGQASNVLTLGPQPGSNSVSATLPGNVVVNFAATAISAGSATVTKLSGDNQIGTAGTMLQPFVVHITNGSQPVSGFTVNWSVVQGGGTLAMPSTLSNGNGEASNILTLGSNPGTSAVQASIPGIGIVMFSATATAQVGNSSQFTIVSGNNQALVPNQPSDPLVIKLVSASGDPIANAVVQWSVSGATAKLANSSTLTGSDGQSQNQLTVVLPGSYTVSAKLPNAPDIASLTFDFSNGVANIPNLSPTQTRVAAAIDKACPALASMSSGGKLSPGQQDLLQRCSELVVGATTDPQNIPNALNQMLNNKALPQRSQAQGVQQGQFNNLNTRFAELRQGARGASIRGLTLVNDGRSLQLATLGDLFRKDPGADDEVGKDFARWGFFATGMVDRGGFSANGTRPGFDFHNESLTAGVDYRFTDNFVAGAALGYNQNSSNLDQNLGKLSVDGYSLNGYFSWYHDNDFYVEGSLVLDWLNYDLQRNITYQIANLSNTGMTSVDQTATASPNGNQSSIALSVGKDFNRGAWAASPYMRLVYSHLRLDGFTESASNPGAPGAGLITSVASRSLDSNLGVIGGRISYTTSFDWGILIPNAMLEWNHEFRNDPQTIVTRFVYDPTQTPIVITDKPPDNSYFNVGIGLNAVLPGGRSGYFSWEHLVGFAGAHENRFSLGIRIEF